MPLSANEKREHVKGELKKLRKELRLMHAGVTEEQIMPDPGEVKEVMTQLEALLEILDPKSARKSKK